ncbi:hypothetical protein ACTFIU_007796 [Dictyostelium citrinum]
MNLDSTISMIKDHLKSNDRLYEISKDNANKRVSLRNKLTLEERFLGFDEINNLIPNEPHQQYKQEQQQEQEQQEQHEQQQQLVDGASLLPNSEPSFLLNKIDQLIDDEKDTTYILLIGITGVGKSTFINMVVNYLKFSSLQDALEKSTTLDQIYTIGTYVEIEDSDKTHKFKLGDVDDYKPGSSMTQIPREYRIKLSNGKTICLIDAPGVGDPQGTLQDNKHFENILHEISSLKKLNAICILMRPDETRATVLFSYCLNQLLLHLHSSAKDNIFFCFTHTRGSMYKPGQTKSILEDHLKTLKLQTNIEIPLERNKIFCFDNESFNYLATKLRGNETNFTSYEALQYGLSWDRSSDEFQRLLKEISKVQPHDVANTICINNARTMIGNLAQPMSTCISNININIKLMKEQSERLRNNSIVDESLLYIPETTVESKKLPRCKLICTKIGCTKGSKSPCKEFVPPKEWNSSVYWLENFRFFGSCKECKNSSIIPCLWLNHSLTFVEEIPTLKKNFSLSSSSNDSFGGGINNSDFNFRCGSINISSSGGIGGGFGTLRTKDELKKDSNFLISEMNSRIKQFQNEYQIIKNANIDFSVFLWHHSLVNINHYYEEYINIQIKALENVPNSDDLIFQLNDHLKEYKASVEQQKNGVKSHKTNVKSQKEIFETFDQLLDLPMVGYIIQNQIKLKQNNLLKSEAVIIDLRS